MTAVSTVEVAEPEVRYYKFSVLITGIGRYFRAFLPLLLVTIVNALIQALLVIPNIFPEMTLGFIATVIPSFIVLVVSFAILNGAALAAATPGRVSIKAGVQAGFAHFWLFLLWAVVEYILVMAGLIIYAPLGLLVLLVTPFITLAAVDGKKNAIGANFRAIGNRFGRYLITVIIAGLLLVPVTYLLLVLEGLFINGFWGALLAWGLMGTYCSWVLASFAALYRSTKVGAPAVITPVAVDPTPLRDGPAVD